MIIGVPKEIKDNENRIGITPAGVHLLRQGGHEVLVQKNGGVGSGIEDEEFAAEGAEIIDTAQELYQKANMIIKVKEPLPPEYELIREDHLIFTYFHFAASEELTRKMIETQAVCVAYETVKNQKGELPLLTPMSEVAGRLAIQAGAKYLEKPQGRGVLLAGVPGVPPAKVVIIGGGTVGANAALIAAGMGAQVSILDINVDRLRYLEHVMPANVVTMLSDGFRIREEVRAADLVVGAVLIAGAKAPVLVPKSYIGEMQKGSVVVDVAVDQGGCIETCHPTTLSDPVYEVDGVIHYCVANMPGAVPRTSTFALTNVTMPYARRIADCGLWEAVEKFPELKPGVNIYNGQVTHEGVAEAFDLEYKELSSVIA